jgi:hypothetical protein
MRIVASLDVLQGNYSLKVLVVKVHTLRKVPNRIISPVPLTALEPA